MAKARPKPHVVVADNLHALRLCAGLTQEILAGRAKMDLRSLQRIEAGAWNMTVDYLARFQKALGCRWRDFIAGLDAPPVVTAKPVTRRKPGTEKKEPHKSKKGKLTSKPAPKQDRRAKPVSKRGRA